MSFTEVEGQFQFNGMPFVKLNEMFAVGEDGTYLFGGQETVETIGGFCNFRTKEIAMDYLKNYKKAISIRGKEVLL